MYNNNRISNNIFSLCLGKNGGFFSVGSYNSSYHKKNSSIKTVKMTGKAFYEVKFNKIIVSNNTSTISDGNFIIDSGTTISFFPTKIYENILFYILADCNKNKNCFSNQVTIKNDVCFLPFQGASKKDFFGSFSDIDFIDENSNFTYKWKPKDYIAVMIKKGQKYLCLGFSSHGYYINYKDLTIIC